mgnify:CR=1 FL=1
MLALQLAGEAGEAEPHKRVLAGRAAGHFGEIEPLIDGRGNVYKEDDGVRTDSTPEKLGKLRPVFDPVNGTVTAGANSIELGALTTKSPVGRGASG